MKYYSHYIWENGEVKEQNPVSLVLQQAKLRKGRCLLACICDGTRSIENESLVSGYVTERLVEWFHGKCIPILQITANDAKIRHMLEEELEKIEEEVKEFEKQKGIRADYDILGMTVWNDCFCCFWKGGCKGYIFNKRFNRNQRRNLKDVIFRKEESQVQFVEGNLQKGVGILLCSSLFEGNLREEEMLEVLSEEGLGDKDIGKRLRELWKENQKRGERGHAGAVFFRAE